MTPERVSVIIPTHNRLEVLRRAVQSVCDQSVPIHEIIVIDDGSTDGTSAWLGECAAISVSITQSNHGVSHARNRGIECATGQWIALLDSDDYWYPDKLKHQLSALIKHPGLRLCHCDEHWFRNGRRVNQKHKHRKHGGDIFEQCLSLCAISPSAALIHHSVFGEIGLFDENLPACEDYDLWLRITSREPVLYVDQPLLAKTGGHADQLSQRYFAMDRFRIIALAKLLRSKTLDPQQQTLTYEMMREKMKIYSSGAIKRDRKADAKDFLEQFVDLVGKDSVNVLLKT